MPQYVLNRDYTLIGGMHRIGFRKGIPVNVPPQLEVEAARIGAECVDGPTAQLLAPEPAPNGGGLCHAAFLGNGMPQASLTGLPSATSCWNS
jgi:hypothetical protein